MAPPYGETIWQTHAEWLASPCFLRGLRLSPPTPEKINAKKKNKHRFHKSGPVSRLSSSGAVRASREQRLLIGVANNLILLLDWSR